ncbi:MAG: hypothetical protein KGJ81_02575 [Alphaproteobacteria bacterium]|nr:hypothetical protein [Alphaproteobacteria bacterium]
MSEGGKAKIARRPFLGAALAALGLAAAGGAAYKAGLLGPFYPKTPYDDLLDLLPDRAAAITVGKAVLAREPAYLPKPAAVALRRHIGRNSLSRVLAVEVAADRLSEVDGWLLPATLADLSALAAKADG